MLRILNVLLIIITVWSCNKMNSKSIDFLLKGAFTALSSAENYDVARIYTDKQYILLQELFSPLVEYDNNGILRKAAVESFLWNGDELYFKMRDNHHTVDGHKITAEDALISLKRIIILSGSTHADLYAILCEDKRITNINEDCKNLYIKDNQLVIRIKEKKESILPMLSTMDYAIIPKNSIDSKTLKIIDYKNTTGPYYVDKDFDEESKMMRLLPNKSHFHYKENMPQIVELYFSDAKNSSMEMLKNGQIDYISTVDAALVDDVLSFYEASKDSYSVHKTRDIKILCMHFTDYGIKSLSKVKRYQIASKVKQVASDTYKGKLGYKLTNQFIPEFGEGSIPGREAVAIEHEILKAKIDNTQLTEIDMSIVSAQARAIGAPLSGVKAIKQYISKPFARFSNDLKSYRPHAEIYSIDGGFQEDISLLSYAINVGVFGISREDGKKWLEEYVALPIKEDRLAKFRELHRNALKEAYVVPFATAPYVALIRKGWKMNFSTLYANAPIWMIEKE